MIIMLMMMIIIIVLMRMMRMMMSRLNDFSSALDDLTEPQCRLVNATCPDGRSSSSVS